MHPHGCPVAVAPALHLTLWPAATCKRRGVHTRCTTDLDALIDMAQDDGPTEKQTRSIRPDQAQRQAWAARCVISGASMCRQPSQCSSNETGALKEATPSMRCGALTSMAPLQSSIIMYSPSTLRPCAAGLPGAAQGAGSWKSSDHGRNSSMVAARARHPCGMHIGSTRQQFVEDARAIHGATNLHGRRNCCSNHKVYTCVAGSAVLARVLALPMPASISVRTKRDISVTHKRLTWQVHKAWGPPRCRPSGVCGIKHSGSQCSAVTVREN